jgi:MFS family permease
MLVARTANGTNWVQVMIATFAQNFATGLAFGSFGTLVLALEQEYSASRSTSSLAIALMLVSLSLTAAVLGRILERVSIRTVMIAGALLAAAAFLAASAVTQASQLLAVYFFILGPATAMLGILPSNTLAARWASDRHRGLALGIVNMPIMVTIVPIAIAPLVQAEGIRTVYQILAGALILFLPLLLFVRDRRETAPAAGSVSIISGGQRSSSAILRRPIFWLLVVAQGLLVGAGTMKLAHFVPLFIEQGRTFEEANILLAITGGAGLFGSFLFGAIADRVGGSKALMANCLLQAVMWTVFLAPVGLPVLILDAIVVGACGAGAQAAFGVTLATLFGTNSFSRAFGLMALFTLPFLFGLTPLASLLYEASGSYHLPMGLMVGFFMVAAGLFYLVTREERDARIRAQTFGAD